jgi:transcriptional regulator with XRE-family HTH domain
MNQNKQTLAKKLKDARKDRNLSLMDVVMSTSGADYRVSTETLKNWESGKYEPRLSDLKRLAKVYGKSVGYFFN